MCVIVTILVFMELALQFGDEEFEEIKKEGHNPCFYGISFAICAVIKINLM